MCWPVGYGWLIPGLVPDVAGVERSGAEAGGISQVHAGRLGSDRGPQEHVKAGWWRASHWFFRTELIVLM